MRYLVFLFLISNVFANDIIKSEDINKKFNKYKEQGEYGFMPIGSIIPFHKNHTQGVSLPIPEGWVECDGGTYAVEQNGPLDPDGDGLYKVPDINTQKYSLGKGRYLRGGSVSGHFNKATAWNDNNYAYNGGGSYYRYGANFGRFFDLETGTRSSYSESKLNPDNYRFQVTAMTVVYIMRVK